MIKEMFIVFFDHSVAHQRRAFFDPLPNLLRHPGQINVQVGSKIVVTTELARPIVDSEKISLEQTKQH